jgi:hypothetical protein
LIRWKTAALSRATVVAVWVPAVGAQTPPLLPDPQVQQGRREVNHDKAKLHKDRRVTAK